MKISYNWLKTYVNTNLPVERVSEILTDTGLEVEGLEKVEAVKGGLQGVVVGEVMSCEKHENADRLNVTTVNVGDETLQIVCGAPNVSKGQKVVVATVGTKLYPSPEEGFKIKKSKIRGVESNGMICAEDELGIGKSHDGIIVLDESSVPGSPVSDIFGLEDDYTIEIGLTPNRADAMGHIGVARDLIAYLNFHEKANLSLNWPNSKFSANVTNNFKVSVNVESEDCSRYTGVTIENVEVKPSPEWLQKRLRSIGLSPINNVVDCTNFVMHELGTPLHAFDGDKLNGKIVVRKAKTGDKFTTLDEVERELAESNLMITNGQYNLCIAGVFGGIDSGISDSSTNVFLESAYFNPVSVRKTAKMHGLNTDSSFRFERGVDPNLTLLALKRTALLIQELAGGQFGMEVVDTNPVAIAPTKIEFSYERCSKLIGENISETEVDEILKNLDIHVSSKENGIAQLEVPAYRVDVNREADVVEEVLRIYGFNKVAIPSKLNSSIGTFPKPNNEKIQIVVSDFLVANGYFEMMNNSLTKAEYSESFNGNTVNKDSKVELLNPLSRDLNVMRQSLLFNSLESVAYNQNRQQSDVKLFEFGKTYNKYESGYVENRRLILALSGLKVKENWNSSNEKANFSSIKGIVLGLFDRLGLSSLLSEKELKSDLFEDGLQLAVTKRSVGNIGWISNKMKKEFGLKSDVFIADLDWDAILDCIRMVKLKFKEIPKTFAVRRDFSLLLDNKISFSEISTIAKQCDKSLLKEVGLFDVYEGKNLEKGKKSYAVSFKFQDAEKTLKDNQVDASMEKIRIQLEQKLGAQLR